MAATSKSAALTREILEKLASLKDPDLEARNDATPDRVPFTKRACAERLRTFAAHRGLPSSEGGAQPKALARRGFRSADDAVLANLRPVSRATRKSVELHGAARASMT